MTSSSRSRTKPGQRPIIIGVVTILTFALFLPSLAGEVFASPQPPSGIAWIKEPLVEVFIRIQDRFIGVIPGNYTEPTGADYQTMRTVFSLINFGISNNDPGSIQRASSLAERVNYQLLPINDSNTGHSYYVLTENDAANRGWGSYFFAADQGTYPSPRVIIEAPHPVTDFNSQNIAFEVFTNSYPRVLAFFVSGVLRTLGPDGQTDMAHRSQSIFETATEVFSGLGTVLIQVHSFDAGRHPAYPMVILSTGDGGLSGALQSIASNLLASGISVGIFDGFKYESLSATGNIQGRYVRAIGGGFVHVEVSSTVVYNSTLISRLQGSLEQSVGSGFVHAGYQIDPRIPAVSLSVVAIFFVGRFLPHGPKRSEHHSRQKIHNAFGVEGVQAG